MKVLCVVFGILHFWVKSQSIFFSLQLTYTHIVTISLFADVFNGIIYIFLKLCVCHGIRYVSIYIFLCSGIENLRYEITRKRKWFSGFQIRPTVTFHRLYTRRNVISTTIIRLNVQTCYRNYLPYNSFKKKRKKYASCWVQY